MSVWNLLLIAMLVLVVRGIAWMWVYGAFVCWLFQDKPKRGPMMLEIREEDRMHLFFKGLSFAVVFVFALWLTLDPSVLWLARIAFIFWLPMLGARVGGDVANLLRLSLWNKPISEQFLGPNRTWAECYTGLMLAVGATKLGEWLFGIILDASWEYGAAIGLGALLAENYKSFLKRAQEKPPGTPWEWLDATTYVFVGWTAYALVTVQCLDHRFETFYAEVLCVQLLYAVLWASAVNVIQRVRIPA